MISRGFAAIRLLVIARLPSTMHERRGSDQLFRLHAVPDTESDFKDGGFVVRHELVVAYAVDVSRSLGSRVRIARLDVCEDLSVVPVLDAGYLVPEHRFKPIRELHRLDKDPGNLLVSSCNRPKTHRICCTKHTFATCCRRKSSCGPSGTSVPGKSRTTDCS